MLSECLAEQIDSGTRMLNISFQLFSDWSKRVRRMATTEVPTGCCAPPTHSPLPDSSWESSSSPSSSSSLHLLRTDADQPGIAASVPTPTRWGAPNVAARRGSVHMDRTRTLTVVVTVVTCATPADQGPSKKK